MECPGCKAELQLPALFIGYTEMRIPVAQFHCQCGSIIKAQIDTMKPYTAERAEKYPPGRGEYFGKDKPHFCCPVCKGLAGISQPVHTISDIGEVFPSWVCPYGCGFHTFMTLGGWKEL